MVPNPMEPGPTEFPVSRWNQFPFQEEFYFIFFRFRIHALYWAYTVRTFFFHLGLIQESNWYIQKWKVDEH